MMKRLIIRHPVVAYFILAYAISWGGILLIFGSDGLQIFRGEKILSEGFSRQIFFMWLSMLAGPGLASIFLTSIIAGSHSNNSKR